MRSSIAQNGTFSTRSRCASGHTKSYPIIIGRFFDLRAPFGRHASNGQHGHSAGKLPACDEARRIAAEYRETAGVGAHGVKRFCQVMRPAATETVQGPLSRYPSVASCWRRHEKRPQTKNRRSNSGNAKCDRRTCRSDTRIAQAQPARHRSERNAPTWGPSQSPETRNNCPPSNRQI